MSYPNPFDATSTGHGAGSLCRLAGILFALVMAFALPGCLGGGGGSTQDNSDVCVVSQAQLETIHNIDELPAACLALLPIPEDNLLGRVFVLGTQVDGATGELHIYANGTDLNGQPLQLIDFQAAAVTVNDVPVAAAVQAVSPGDPILSVGLVTDYSTSINNAELTAITDVYANILTLLPAVFEAEVLNFSDTVVVRQDWTESENELVAAIQLDSAMVRNNTAFYDALGTALQRDLAVDTDGLIERCRPAHLLIAFTDGRDNASTAYTPTTLRSIIDDSSAVMIMLGTLAANSDELSKLAGSNGAFAYAYDVSSIQAVIHNWSESLSHMVRFTLAPATGFDSGVIKINMPGETTVVRRPVDGFCEVAP